MRIHRAALLAASVLGAMSCRGVEPAPPAATMPGSSIDEPADAEATSEVTPAPSIPQTPPAPSPATYCEAAVPGAPFDMVWIPEGHFWIGRTEVTWDEYLPFCDWQEEDRLLEGVDAISRPSKPLETYPYDREWGTGRRPAVGMSWNAARKYCEWLSAKTGHAYRLPTEAEWQLACGPRPADLDACAWYDDNSDDRTQEVAQKQPNAHGLHDMLGNLWEYCDEPFDPAEPDWAVLHGGSWADPVEDADPEVRLKFDEFWNLMDSNVPPGVWWVPDGDHLGFRVLRPGPEPQPQPEGNTP